MEDRVYSCDVICARHAVYGAWPGKQGQGHAHSCRLSWRLGLRWRHVLPRELPRDALGTEEVVVRLAHRDLLAVRRPQRAVLTRSHVGVAQPPDRVAARRQQCHLWRHRKRWVPVHCAFIQFGRVGGCDGGARTVALTWLTRGLRGGARLRFHRAPWSRLRERVGWHRREGAVSRREGGVLLRPLCAHHPGRRWRRRRCRPSRIAGLCTRRCLVDAGGGGPNRRRRPPPRARRDARRRRCGRHRTDRADGRVPRLCRDGCGRSRRRGCCGSMRLCARRPRLQ